MIKFEQSECDAYVGYEFHKHWHERRVEIAGKETKDDVDCTKNVRSSVRKTGAVVRSIRLVSIGSSHFGIEKIGIQIMKENIM